MPSKFLSKTFQKVEIKSRALDSDALYERIAALTAGTAPLGFGARELTLARKAVCRLKTRLFDNEHDKAANDS